MKRSTRTTIALLSVLAMTLALGGTVSSASPVPSTENVTTEVPDPVTSDTPVPSSVESSSAGPSEPSGYGALEVSATDAASGEAVGGVQVTVTGDGEKDDGVTPYSVLFPVGAVTVTATAPTGYELVDSPQSVQIVDSTTAHIRFTLKKTVDPPPQGVLYIQKFDRITGAQLGGATFTVTTCDGKTTHTVSTGGATGSPHSAAVQLPPGCASVTETVAPPGYRLDSTPYRVTVVSNSEVGLSVYDLPITPVVVERNTDRRVPIKSVPSGRIS